MHCTFEWKTQHAVDIIPGSYFSSALIGANGTVDASRGHDEFQLNAMILPEKRLAGFGREQSYQLDDLPAGLSALEAAPSQPLELPEPLGSLAFAVDTNLFPGQDCLSQQISLAIKHRDMYREIPLQSPAVAIDWQARGKYIVRIKDL